MELVEKKGFLSAADILKAEDLDYKEVEVPEWGGTIRLRAMSAVDSLIFLVAMEGENKKKQANTRLVAMSVVDENGNKVFTENQLSALEGKNVRVINRLAEEVLILNGMSAKKKDAEKKAEDVKNV